MRKVIVGVSGLNAADNPGPGVGVARSLREDPDLDVGIVGLAYDAMEPGIYLDWVVDRSYLMPYPSGSLQAYADRLRYIKSAHGLDYVIPNLDSELPLYIKLASSLNEQGIGCFLPTMEQFGLRGKDRLPAIAQRIGTAVPRTEVVNSLSALVKAVEEIGVPVMLKGCFCGARQARSIPEACFQHDMLVAEWGHPVIVQEVVSGEGLNVVGVGDGEGGSLGLVAIKKTSVTSLGKIWTGVTIRNEQMLEAAARFVRELRWRGPFELECLVQGDTIYLIEVNPRFPAWCYFATAVGVNLPARMLRRSLGLPLPAGDDYPAGKLFIRYSYELVTDLAPFQKAVTRGETP